jgi:hypothetical protein
MESVKYSLVKKISLLIILFIYIPIIIGGIMLLNNIHDNSVNNYNSSSQTTLSQISYQLSRYVSDAIIHAESLSSDPDVARVMVYNNREQLEIVKYLNNVLPPRISIVLQNTNFLKVE